MKLEKLLCSSEITEFKDNIQKGIDECLFGLSISEKSILFSIAGGGIYVAGDLVDAEKVSAQALACGIKNKILSSSFSNSCGVKDNSTYYEFITSVYDFVQGKLNALIVLSETLFEKIPSEESLEKYLITVNSQTTFDKLLKGLLASGYTREELPSRKGQFSVRGDIIDIWNISENVLTRVEFFGDDLEKISKISAEDFSILREEKSTIIYPAQLFEVQNRNLLDLKSTIFYDEPKKLEAEAQNFSKNIENAKLFVTKNIFESQNTKVSFNNLLTQTNFFSPKAVLNFKTSPAKKYIFDYRELVKDVKMYVAGGYKVCLFCGSEHNKTRLSKFLTENSISFVDFDYEDAGVRLSEEYLPQSAHFLSLDCIIIGTDALYKKEPIKSAKKDKVFYTPRVGDYVVHQFHGVGKCIALQRMKLADIEKEYFIIEYLGGDKFYLPAEQTNTISAFLGADNAPKLNKLGGAEFERIKQRVYKNVKELAVNLLELYSERENANGYIYEEGGELFELFENSFEFEETADQLSAIADIISDMENGKLMDRLVCGDVGYGKTEVALRAIYKAVINGKQVAFLCPTTILAEQHYITAKKRFEGFMVNLAKLDRLVQPQCVRETIKKLASGQIDVVIGTHKLLSKDIHFKNLGLLVIDEEQRFGVGDKEKIKNLKKNIDVLTLSATPIPRTLHMSLSGIRDISIIDTPPKERLPIQTYVTEYSENLIVEACRKELSRGGQILVVYNRVETIFDFGSHLKELIPEAKIGIAHGQLPQKHLEDTIMKLYDGEFNILVATTLIENGIDLPRANTLIVIDSDRLGLSQLYQLRGRIGRSDKSAYAYFTFNGNKVLTEQAYKRLEAIMEFTELGSGFKIAMRDLEIRGAGNVLGKEQHGHMGKVGYDMYCKLLKEAVSELQGEKVKEKKEIKMEIELSAYIPEEYIVSESERIKKYAEISEITTLEALHTFEKSLSVSYGGVPEVVQNIMLVALLKNLAQKQDVKKVVINSGFSKLYLYKQESVISEKLAKVLDENKHIAVLKFAEMPIIEFKMKGNVKDNLKQIISLLI